MGSDTVQAEHDGDLETEDITIDALLDELAAYYAPYELQPGEFTVTQVMDRIQADCDRGDILKDLKRRAQRGEFGMKVEKIKGRRQFVFWVIKNPPL